MADAHILLPLTKMVDLITQSPEDGVINFNMLSTVLHVIVKQLNASDLSVELHGPNAKKLENMIQEDNLQKPSVHITKIIGGDKKDTSDATTETVFVVKPEERGEHVGITITKQQLDRMNFEIEEIKDKIRELIDLPSNVGLIEAIRSEIQPSPVIDMFQILSLTKRLDAAEIGMNKLAGLVEEAIKTPAFKSEICFDKPEKADSSSKSPKTSSAKPGTSSKTERHSGDRDSVGRKVGRGSKQSEKVENDDDGPSRDEKLNALVEEVENIKTTLDSLMFPGKRVSNTPNGSDTSLDKSKTSSSPLAQLYKDVEEIKDKLFINKSPNKVRDSDDEIELPPDLKLKFLEEKFKDCAEQLEAMDQNFNDEIAKLHNQFTDMEKDFNEIILKVSDAMPTGDRGPDEPRECCQVTHQKLLKLREDFDELATSSYKIIDDKEKNRLEMDLILEEIQLLKISKADKEYMEEALADKADACTVQRKVSHDLFDNACDTLSKGIEDALEKLTQQETIWQHTLDDIQGEIGTKLDKIDLGPLREFINNKLKILQDKMKSLAALKKEQEAAGSKNKLLRDVNCISCDKDVVMRKEMDITMRPPTHTLPATRSMGPYLAYELDVLRRQQKTLPGSRNLNDYERALQMGKSKKTLIEDHLCNRYCGGSHTITTPHQRVIRLGNFLNQWGPEAASQGDGLGLDANAKNRSLLLPPGTSNVGKEVKESKEQIVEKQDSKQKLGADEKAGAVKSKTTSARKVSKARADSAQIRRASIISTGNNKERASSASIQSKKRSSVRIEASQTIKANEDVEQQEQVPTESPQDAPVAQEKENVEENDVTLVKSTENARNSASSIGRNKEDKGERKSGEIVNAEKSKSIIIIEDTIPEEVQPEPEQVVVSEEGE